MFLLCSHLSLDAVESSEPENLSSPQLPLRVVYFLIIFIDVLLWHVVFLSQLSGPPQEA